MNVPPYNLPLGAGPVYSDIPLEMECLKGFRIEGYAWSFGNSDNVLTIEFEWGTGFGSEWHYDATNPTQSKILWEPDATRSIVVNSDTDPAKKVRFFLNITEIEGQYFKPKYTITGTDPQAELIAFLIPILKNI